jgi:transposase
MAMGKRRRRPKQTSMWVATQDLPRTAAHPFYARLNQILDKADFDGYVESLCQRFYADEIGRPGLAPGRYFRLLLVGYFEGLDAERAIAWRAADSFALREFLGLVLPEAPPDHSTISRTRRLIDLETHEAVFTWILQRLADAGLVIGKTIGIDDFLCVQINLPGVGAKRGGGGGKFVGSAEPWTVVRFQRPHGAHNRPRRLHPQHSIDVTHLWHTGNITVPTTRRSSRWGCALICWQSLRTAWMAAEKVQVLLDAAKSPSFLA